MREVFQILGVGEESTVTSSSKLKLPCCAAQQVHPEIHPDFFNQEGIDANDVNNIGTFVLKLR
jgi:hypothetical protein